MKKRKLKKWNIGCGKGYKHGIWLIEKIHQNERYIYLKPVKII